MFGFFQIMPLGLGKEGPGKSWHPQDIREEPVGVIRVKHTARVSGRGRVLWKHREESGSSCQPRICPDLEGAASLSHRPPASGKWGRQAPPLPSPCLTHCQKQCGLSGDRLQAPGLPTENGERGEELGVGVLYWVRG